MNSTYLQRILRSISFLLCLCLVAPAALAQSTDQDSCSRRPCSPVASNQPLPADQSTAAANQEPDPAQSTHAQTGYLNTKYTVALNGAEPIAVTTPKHLHLLYALSTSQGFESEIAGPFSNIDSYTSVYEGYIGALWRFTRSYVVLQHDSAFTHFGDSLLRGAGFHQTGLFASVDFDPNLNWTFEANSSIGNNTLTELVRPPQIIVNGIAVSSPSAVAAIDLGLVWGSDVVSTLNWKADSHDIFSFRAENANHQFYGLDQH